MSTRSEQLQKRIEHLKILRNQEYQGDNDTRYIDDLNLTIGQCEAQLNNISRNPALCNDYEMVN